jgi:starvation-inducible DNA-binding protein
MNYIGLDLSKTKLLVTRLNTLLATYQVHYQNVRGLHWNIEGEHFFELHLKYEEIYTRTQDVIDEIAERILTLQGKPFHTFADYLKHAKLKELKTCTNGKKGIEYLLNAHRELLILEREILQDTGKINDEGTLSMISNFIAEKEKSSWMYTAWLASK